MIIGGKSIQRTPDRVIRKTASVVPTSNSSFITSKIEEAVSDLVNNMLQKMKYGRKTDVEEAERYEKELENCDTFLQIFELIQELFNSLIGLYTCSCGAKKNDKGQQTFESLKSSDLRPNLLVNYEKEKEIFKSSQLKQKGVIEALQKQLAEVKSENSFLVEKTKNMEIDIRKMKKMNQISFMKKPQSPPKLPQQHPIKAYKTARHFRTPSTQKRSLVGTLDFSKFSNPQSYVNNCVSSNRNILKKFNSLEKSVAKLKKSSSTKKPNGRNLSYSGKSKKIPKEKTPSKTASTLHNVFEGKLTLNKTKRKRNGSTSIKNKAVFLTHTLTSIKTPKLNKFRQRRALSNSLFNDYVKLKGAAVKKEKGKKKKRRIKKRKGSHCNVSGSCNTGNFNGFVGLSNGMKMALSPRVKSLRTDSFNGFNLGLYLRSQREKGND